MPGPLKTPDSMASKTDLCIMFLTTQGIEDLDPGSAFSKKFTAFLEHVACPYDYPYSEVHCEVFLDGVSYSAFNMHSSSCVVKYNPKPSILSLPCVELVPVPITDIGAARDFLDLAVLTPATYSIPYADFLVPKFVLDYSDPDPPCSNPSAWRHLYCSQFALLFLRHCVEKNLIPLPSDKLSLIDSGHVNSHACSPAHLMRILKQMLS